MTNEEFEKQVYRDVREERDRFVTRMMGLAIEKGVQYTEQEIGSQVDVLIKNFAGDLNAALNKKNPKHKRFYRRIRAIRDRFALRKLRNFLGDL